MKPPASKSKPKNTKNGRVQACLELIKKEPPVDTIYQNLLSMAGSSNIHDPLKDRSTAIVAVAYLENIITKSIILRLNIQKIEEDNNYNYLLYDDSAPCRDFNSRIRFARSIGLITRQQYEYLHVMRQIRNVFAHSMENISFQTQEIQNLYEELSIMMSKPFINSFALKKFQKNSQLWAQQHPNLIECFFVKLQCIYTKSYF